MPKKSLVAITVPDDAYNPSSWDGNLEVPTKNAIRDKLETIPTAIAWSEVTGTTQTAAANSGYITNNASLVVVTLPSTAVVGSIVRVANKGAGGWKIAQPASASVRFGSTITTTGTGGSLQNTKLGDAVELVCITANTGWMVISSVGNITVV